MKFTNTDKKKLLLAVGNISRQDDELGWRFAKQFVEADDGAWDLEYRFQLQIEDAELISHYDFVMVVDATEKQYEKGFSVETPAPAPYYQYSSHIELPANLLYLCGIIFGGNPVMQCLYITGYEWELDYPPTKKALKNLDAALKEFEFRKVPDKVYPDL